MLDIFWSTRSLLAEQKNSRKGNYHKKIKISPECIVLRWPRVDSNQLDDQPEHTTKTIDEESLSQGTKVKVISIYIVESIFDGPKNKINK